MKISLAWIFDHIDADWKKVSVSEVVTRFNQVTAEIEDSFKISIKISQLFLGIVIKTEKEHCVLSVPELKQEIELAARPDKSGNFLLHKDGKSFRWATCKDVGLDKDGLLPAFDSSEKELSGEWRKLFEHEDVIFDVDNKSLTHRPDMWGHRGFAREVAAYLKLPLTNKKQFLSEVKSSNKSPLEIKIKSEKACKRFSGLYFSSIENKPSNLFIASRLIKVGIRPINAVVDLTNYVMLDWSQPVHAYDAEKVSDDVLIARMAKGGEKLDLLNGQQIELAKEDLVIADSEKVLGLAGIMGGLHDSIGKETKSIIFESAHFEPSHIRQTSLRHGIRTESSARFEKTLDPNQITDAILRFINLAEQTGISYETSGDLVVVGEPFQDKTIGVQHSFLEKRSGVHLEKKDIIDPLTRLEFTVVEEAESLGYEDDVLYTITIPSFRGAKDVSIQEDILEEVIRFFGFEQIVPVLPSLKKKPFDSTSLFRLRKIKEFLVRSARMTEQRNYLYYDEDFLSEVQLDYKDALEIKNPVSENNRRIASSLLPNLFKNVKQNHTDSLRFFEAGRVCRMIKKEYEEIEMLSGVYFEKRSQLDFYECKQHLIDLLDICGLSGLAWKKVETKLVNRPYVLLYQSAEIFFNDKKIGIAGKIDPAFLNKINGLPESDAFFFDLSLETILKHVPDVTRYVPISKFPDVTFDLCFMVPLKISVESLESSLFESDDLIKSVQLVDFFDREEWVDKRSVAFRLRVGNPEKTLLKEEIDSVRENALSVAKNMGAELRG